MKRFSDEQLSYARNALPIRSVIEILLQLPHKEVEGVYRFLCPLCAEFETGLNPHTNLARCFRCAKNFNPIELVMAGKGLSFVQSVKLLLQEEPALKRAPSHQQAESAAGFVTVAGILRQTVCRRDNPYSGD